MEKNDTDSERRVKSVRWNQNWNFCPQPHRFRNPGFPIPPVLSRDRPGKRHAADRCRISPVSSGRYRIRAHGCHRSRSSPNADDRPSVHHPGRRERHRHAGSRQDQGGFPAPVWGRSTASRAVMPFPTSRAPPARMRCMPPSDDIIATGGRSRRALLPAPRRLPLHPVHANCRCEAGPCPGGGRQDARRDHRHSGPAGDARHQETRPGDVRLHVAGPQGAEGIRLSEEHAETARGRTGIGRSAVCHDARLLRDPHHRPGRSRPPGRSGGREAAGPLLPDEREARSGASPPGCGSASASGEFPPPDPGRGHERGPPPEPDRPRSGEPGGHAAAGPRPGKVGGRPAGRIHAPQAEEAGRDDRFTPKLSGSAGLLPEGGKFERG